MNTATDAARKGVLNSQRGTKLQRAYTVRIRPADVTDQLGDDEGITNEGWYEPRTVTLWWDEGKAPKRHSTAEQDELARRAVKLETMDFDTPDDREFDVEIVELLREQLVTPKPRKRK